MVDVDVKKDFLNFNFSFEDFSAGVSQLLAMRDLSRCARRWLPHCCHCGDPHDNNKYDPGSSISGLLALLKDSPIVSTVKTLTCSNDNFTYKWYYKQLIRLPIKLGTLDFHDLID
jgi:hypothetical protein